MRALIVDGKGGVKLLHDIPEPILGPYDALVKTAACGICNGTDLKIIAGALKGYHNYPSILGHEAAGEVIGVGEKVNAYHPGDKVIRCGLSGKLGEYESLFGGFAEYTLVTDIDAMKRDGLVGSHARAMQKVLPKQLDLNEATMIITFQEVYSALIRLGIQPGMNVAVAGCGPVGLSMIAILRLMGVSSVTLIGHHDARMQKGAELGADKLINSKYSDLVSELNRYYPQGLDAFIDAVGHCSIINQAFQTIHDDGIIGVYGIGVHSDQKTDWDIMPYNCKLHFVQWPLEDGMFDAYPQLMDWIVNGKLNCSDFVTNVIPVENFQEGFDCVKTRNGLKIALNF